MYVPLIMGRVFNFNSVSASLQRALKSGVSNPEPGEVLYLTHVVLSQHYPFSSTTCAEVLKGGLRRQGKGTNQQE